MRSEAPIPLTPCDLEVWRLGEEVVVVGPGPVAFTMSHDAGLETSRRIAKALARRDASRRS